MENIEPRKLNPPKHHSAVNQEKKNSKFLYTIKVKAKLMQATSEKVKNIYGLIILENLRVSSATLKHLHSTYIERLSLVRLPSSLILCAEDEDNMESGRERIF